MRAPESLGCGLQAAAQAVAEAAHCWGPPLIISTPSSRPDLKSCLSWCPSHRDWLCSPTTPCYRDNCLLRHQLPTCCEARDTLHWSHRSRPRVHLSLQGVLNGLQIHCALVGQVVEDVASVLSSPAPLLEPGGLGTADTSSGCEWAAAAAAGDLQQAWKVPQMLSRRRVGSVMQGH